MKLLENTLDIAKNTTAWKNVFLSREYLVEKAGYAVPFDMLHLAAKDTEKAMETLNRSDVVRIAILGTRDTDLLINENITRIVHELAAEARPGKNPVIISGLALGVDKAAHTAALDAGIPTIAVAATGIDTIYPKVNEPLAEKIYSTPGCSLITQYPNETAPITMNFLERKKTIVLMSDMIIIPGSKKKGGAMVAAKMAYEWGIPVYAVPGRPQDQRSEGCLELIKEGIAEIYYDF